MIKKLLNIRREIVYQDVENKRFYGRIIGGLSWAESIEPGFLVVLGEEFKEDLGLRARRLWLLKEQEGDTVVSLHRLMREMRVSCACDEWVGDKRQEAHLRIFRQENAIQASLPAMVSLRMAPLAGERLGVLLQPIYESLEPERKVLMLGHSRSRDALANIERENLKQPAGQFPILAALGYAVAEMVLRQPRRQGQEPRAISDWDLFAEGAGS